MEPEGTIITEENREEVLADEDVLYQNLYNLWKNYCIQETYEPGSTAKPFTVAAGLESGKMTGNEYYTCNGQLHVGDYDIKCHNYKMGGDGTLSVQQSIEQSCNVALMLMGQQIGKNIFLEYQDRFNFGLKTNIDLAGETRTEYLVFNDKNMGATELATSTFGQGYNVTMIQMISAFSSLINGGYYYEPHLVSKITASDGSVVQNINPRVVKQTVSSATSEKIIEYCNGVVENGTGKTARPAGYAIGGKTGTAETIPRDKTNYVVSFMGYAPADNPQIAIYVVVDRPNTNYQDDAKFATRLVRNILTETLPYLNIYMTEELSEKEQAELAELNISVKKANVIEEDTPEDEEEPEPEVNEDGSIDANGGDTTSSTPVSEEEMQSNNVDTAPLTGTLLNPENAVIQTDGITTEDGE
jgi:stage V sporulation protein D (sporulation-specific penicillin-binding protein)